MAVNKRVLTKINKYLEKKGIGSRIGVGTDGIKINFLTTGLPEVDAVLSGGIAEGRVIHLYGTKSGGKSWLCQKIISEAQKEGKTCAYLDLEQTFDTEWAKNLGVNTDELIYVPVSNAEVTLQVMRELVESEEVDLIVLDSIAALTVQDELDKEFDEEAKIAGTARLMSKAMRVLNTKSSNKVTMIYINQIRSDIGNYGGGSTTPGGKAVGFYATQEISVSRGKGIYKGSGDKREAIGYEMRLMCDKNKVGIPKKKCVLQIYNDGSVDIEDMVINMGMANDIFVQFTKSGNSYFLGEEKIANKRDDFVQYLKDNNKEFIKYKKAIVEEILNKVSTKEVEEDKIEEVTEDELVQKLVEEDKKNKESDDSNETITEEIV